MDATDLEFEASSFDVVLEKATIDALLVEEKDPWNMTSETAQLLDKMMLQVRNSRDTFILFANYACDFF